MKRAKRLRVLFIARYRSAAMESKLVWMAKEPDIELCLIRPAIWEDEYGRFKQAETINPFKTRSLPMLGNPSDPHRAIYRTVTFGLHKWRPDIIHAEEEPDSLSALQIALVRRLWRPRARLLFHTWQNVDRPKRWYVHAVLRAVLRESDAVFCANREAATLLRRYGYQRPTPCTPSIGVDTDLFRPRSDGGEIESPPSFTIGYIGRLVEEKGIDVLIRAVAALRCHTGGDRWRVRIVGSGAKEDTLRALVTAFQMDDAVSFVPPLPGDRMPEAICALDALVLPSRTTRVWKEQLGRVLLEAMACGVPVIGSDSGAIPEVIDDAGLIFPEDDVDELADRLMRLEANPGLRATLALRGRQRVEEHYSQRRLAEETVTVYRQLLGYAA